MMGPTMRTSISLILFPVILFLSIAVQAQDSQPAAPTLGELARQHRAQKAAGADNAPDSTTSGSLGEIARTHRENQAVEVKITEKDSRALFSAMGAVLDFASQDTGLPKHSNVKYQLVSQADVTKRFSEGLSENSAAQALAREELVLKKFGYLPPSFDFKKSMISHLGKSIEGYYDNRNKTMHLVNWVELEQQLPIMAHELTHALQDQNYDLFKWRSSHQRSEAAKTSVDFADSEESSGRTSVVEGQAMVVYMDYLLRPVGHSLAEAMENRPELMDTIRARIESSIYDTSMVLHDAPLLLKESTIFPYREGLLFEMALLRRGGKNMAFAGAFARPPWDTHEILEPEAYFAQRKRLAVVLPDLKTALAGRYAAYDSGTMGQLDVRILAQQYGTENDVDTITPAWQGGAFVAVRRAEAAEPVASTADLALLYVSRWKTREAAQRFAEVYKKSLPKRVKIQSEDASGAPACTANCPQWSARVNTDEGPVLLEVWPNNTLLIAQSFDDETLHRLRPVVLAASPAAAAKTTPSDLSLRLLQLPEFQALQAEARAEIMKSLEQLMPATIMPATSGR